jgi:predicted HTH domain antitoxin
VIREYNPMQITLNLPDSLSQTETFNQSDWLREIAMALFQQERISLGRASKIAGVDVMDFQKLLADRGIYVHYDVEDFEQDVQHLRDRGWL